MDDKDSDTHRADVGPADPRGSGRRQSDDRKSQALFKGEDRRKGERRSGGDRRAHLRDDFAG